MRKRDVFFSKRFAQSILIGLGILIPVLGITNPKKGDVVSGDIKIDSSRKVLTVTQSSDKAIIDWKDFSIQKDETTQFVQPSSESFILNKVHGENFSDIQGSLISNGKVFLANPQGIIFGPNCYISTKGFLATTLIIAKKDFLSGNNLVIRGDSNAKIENFGVIRAEDSNVYLLAKEVVNKGNVQAENGVASLIGSKEVLLSKEFDKTSIKMPSTGMVCNEGVIRAAQVELKAAGGNLYSIAVSNNGVIEAKGIRKVSDRIILQANDDDGEAPSVIVDEVVEGKILFQSETGTTYHDGNIMATSPDGKGGKIHILGEEVRLGDEATTSVNAPLGSGEILFGGDYRGENPEIPNAKRLFIPFETQTIADATDIGDGGKVICWANDEIHMAGFITARGKGKDHKGGFVEVSSHGIWDYKGHVDTQCIGGGNESTGTLLFDPTDITISNAATDPNMSGAGGPPTKTWTVTPPPDNGNLSVATLVSDLLTNNVIVDSTIGGAATGLITVSDAISWSVGNFLELRAANDITINAPITAGGYLFLNSNSGGSGKDVIVSSPISSALYRIDISAREKAFINADITSTNAGVAPGIMIDIQASGGEQPGIVVSGATISSQTGDIVFLNGPSSGGADPYAEGITLQNGGGGNSSTVITTSGDININGQFGPVNFASDGRFGVNIQADSSVQTMSGNISITGANYATFATAINQFGIGIRGDVTSSGFGGTGSITLTGTGSALDGSAGIRCFGGSGVVSSESDPILMNGSVTSSGSADVFGIKVDSSAQIVSGLNATITLNGTVNGTSTSANQRGVLVDEGLISASGAAVTVTGTVNVDAGVPLEFTNNSEITSSGSGPATGSIGLIAAGNKPRIECNSSTITVVDADVNMSLNVPTTDYLGISIANSIIDSQGIGANAGDISIVGNFSESGGNGRAAIWLMPDATIKTQDGGIFLSGDNTNSTSGTVQQGVLVEGVLISEGTFNSGKLVNVAGTAPDLPTSRGVRIDGGMASISSETNDIIIVGTCTTAGTNTGIQGVNIVNSAEIISTGSNLATAATISVTGSVLGTGTGADSYGIYTLGASILTDQASVTFTGTESTTGLNNHVGLHFQNSTITNPTGLGLGASVGTVTFTGDGTYSRMEIDGSTISLKDADISMNLLANLTIYKRGIDITNSTVETTGTGINAGDISVVGAFSGDEMTGFPDAGVGIDATSKISTIDGGISLQGSNVNSLTSNRYGVKILGEVSSSGSEKLITGNTLSITGTYPATLPGISDSSGVFISGASALVSSETNNISISGTSTVATAFGGLNGIVISNGSLVSSTGSDATTAATISLSGTLAGSLSGFGCSGIYVDGADIETDQGAVTLTGMSTSTFGDNHRGVSFEDAKLTSTGIGGSVGSITLIGSSAGENNAYAIHLFTSLGSTYISSAEANISMTGTTSATLVGNAGVRMDGTAYVQQSGSGTLQVTGTGSGTNSSHGVNLIASSYLQSSGGKITVVGSSTAVGSTNKGVYVEGSLSRISALGSTDIQVTGNGAGAAPFPSGVEVDGKIEAFSGDIDILATPGAGTDGLVMTATGLIGGVFSTGDITITAPSVDLYSTGSATVLQGTGFLYMLPSLSSSTIGIGDGSVGTFNLNNNETRNIGSGFQRVRFGHLTTGTHTIDVASPIPPYTTTPAFSCPLYLIGDDISVGASTTLNGTDVVFEIGQVNAGTFILNETGYVNVSGTFQVLGGTNDDSFSVLDPNQVIDILDGISSGPTAENVLITSTQPKNIYITGLNAGNTNSGGAPFVPFQNIQNVTGGSNDDDFYIRTVDANLTGTVGLDGAGSTVVGNYLNSPTGISTNFNLKPFLPDPVHNNRGTITPLGGAGTNFRNIEILVGSTAIDYLDYTSNPSDPLMIDFLNYKATDVNAIASGAPSTTSNSFKDIEGVILNNATVVNLTGNPNPPNNINVLGLSSGTNTWTVTGPNQGNVVTLSIPRTVYFTNFASLLGGTGDDEFIIIDGQSLTGFIDGGEPGGKNKLDYTNYSTPVSIDLVTGASTNIGGGVSNIVDADVGLGTILGGMADDVFYVKVGGASFVDGDVGTNTLVGPLHPNVWTVDGSQTVPASGFINSTIDVDFDRCQRLVGGGVADTFIMTGIGAVDSIDGGSDYDTLQAKDQDNTWEITDNNAGTVPSVGEFVSIEHLLGGSQSDTFIMGDQKGVSGIIDGGSNSGNVLDYSNYTTFVRVDYANKTATNIGGFDRIQEVIYPQSQISHERGFLISEMITTLLYHKYDHIGNYTKNLYLRMKAFQPYEGYHWLKENDLIADEDKQEEIWK